MTLELIRAKISSTHIRKSQAAISLLAVVKGFFVEISKPAKNDCEMPMYSTGSILTIDRYFIIKYNEKLPIFGYFWIPACNRNEPAARIIVLLIN
jgi:hypothetical protein